MRRITALPWLLLLVAQGLSLAVVEVEVEVETVVETVGDEAKKRKVVGLINNNNNNNNNKGKVEVVADKKVDAEVEVEEVELLVVEPQINSRTICVLKIVSSLN
jgi:hypothetical protein